MNAKEYTVAFPIPDTDLPLFYTLFRDELTNTTNARNIGAVRILIAFIDAMRHGT